METFKVKVVTIVATAELRERVEKDLWSLGVRDMAIGKVDGVSAHGHRRPSFLDSGNVRIETLVDGAVAAKILERVVQDYEGQEIVAYAGDVEAVPRSRFPGGQ